MTKIIITYGTLRREGTNHNYYLREGSQDIKFLGEGKIKGFDLYDLGCYPAITKGEGEVVAEIYEISEDIFKTINNMEKGVGYNSKEVIVNGIKGTIWFFKEETLKLYGDAKKIEQGDYLKFKDEEVLGQVKHIGIEERNKPIDKIKKMFIELKRGIFQKD